MNFLPAYAQIKLAMIVPDENMCQVFYAGQRFLDFLDIFQRVVHVHEPMVAMAWRMVHEQKNLALDLGSFRLQPIKLPSIHIATGTVQEEYGPPRA